MSQNPIELSRAGTGEARRDLDNLVERDVGWRASPSAHPFVFPLFRFTKRKIQVSRCLSIQ
jgi:hypothetical protein